MKIHIMIPLVLAIYSQNVFSTPVIKEQYHYYTIEGLSAAELRQQMDNLGIKWEDEKTYDAITKWNVRWRFKYDETDILCYIASVTTFSDVDYTYPQWINANEADDVLHKKWLNYLVALEKHEQGHRNFAVGAATQIERSIEKLSAEKSCDQLGDKANQIGHQTLEKYINLEREYDLKTRHGETQGAVFR
ncbi:MAG: DUF922 domain-containing protein [Gammaproteobacteria bacterium]|nr:DUF922 domain-containing protein [Gammaproteobacteria bacterium]